MQDALEQLEALIKLEEIWVGRAFLGYGIISVSCLPSYHPPSNDTHF